MRCLDAGAHRSGYSEKQSTMVGLRVGSHAGHEKSKRLTRGVIYVEYFYSARNWYAKSEYLFQPHQMKLHAKISGVESPRRK